MTKKKPTYKMAVIKIPGVDIGLDVLNKWMEIQNHGEFEITVTKTADNTINKLSWQRIENVR